MVNNPSTYWSRTPTEDEWILKKLTFGTGVDSPARADLLVHDAHLRNPDPETVLQTIERDLDVAIQNRRKLLVLIIGDFEGPYLSLDPYGDHLAVFRTSLLRSTKRHYEQVLPFLWHFCDAPLEPVVNPLPVVSFCGLVSHSDRAELIKLIESMEGVDTAFDIQDKFWGGKPWDSEVIRRFYSNMNKGEFNICARGKGNFSMRLFETLAAGRIPVLLTRDTVLPFENEINWNEIAVVADRIEELDLQRFINSHDLVEAQRRCREVHEAYFSPQSFSDRLIRMVLSDSA